MSEVWQPARFVPFEDERRNQLARQFLKRAGMQADDLWVRSERPRAWGCREIDPKGRVLGTTQEEKAWLSNITNERTGHQIVIAAHLLELQPECREQPPAYFVLGQEE